MNEKKIVAALENNAFSDFEDGLQEECAVESMADYIVTRNPADFKHSRVKVILPDELLRKLEKINYQKGIQDHYFGSGLFCTLKSCEFMRRKHS